MSRRIWNWFDLTAWRVFWRDVPAPSASASVTCALAVSPLRELPLGVSFEVQLWHKDSETGGTGPHLAVGFGLGLVELEIGVGDVRSDLGVRVQHDGRKGYPPHVLFGGRFLWVKVSRAW